MWRILQRLAHSGGLSLQFTLDQFFDDAMIALGAGGGIPRLIKLLMRDLHAPLCLDLAAGQPVAVMGGGKEAEAVIGTLTRRDILPERFDAVGKCRGARRAIRRGGLFGTGKIELERPDAQHPPQLFRIAPHGAQPSPKMPTSSATASSIVTALSASWRI